MEPWELMMSESQERMLACVQEDKKVEVARIFSKWGFNSVVIGKVTDDGMVRIRNDGQIVAEVPAEALTTPPAYDMSYTEPEYIGQLRGLDLSQLPEHGDWGQVLLRLLGSPNLGSKRWVWEQYDHMVQTNTIVSPGSDAAVLRIKGTDKRIA
jgi:phosphoribosylformylglycinamidine synthase